MFYNRLLKLCEERNVKVTNLIKELGMSQGNLSRWKQGGVPKSDTLRQLAQYLNVSVDYLTGNDEVKSEMLALLDSDPIDQQIAEIIRLYRLCDARGQVRIAQVALNEWERTQASEKEVV